MHYVTMNVCDFPLIQLILIMHNPVCTIKWSKHKHVVRQLGRIHIMQ